MIYRVYTDAATKVQDGYSSVAFLVLQGNTYLKAYSSVLQEKNISSAESVAVGLALKYLVEEVSLTKFDKVVLYCDSLYTVKFATKRLKMYKAGEDLQLECERPTKAYWLYNIYDYIPKVNADLTFRKIRAHQQGKNPHCYVDRLAKSGLTLN